MITRVSPVGSSSLCSEENAAWPVDNSGEKNRTARYRKAKLTRSDIISYNTDRIDWIRAGSPGTFHDWRVK